MTDETGAISENIDNTDSPGGNHRGGGLPLRGFAMVLVAVAIVLCLWAFYAFTGGNEDATQQTTSTAAPTSSAAVAPASPSSAIAEAPAPTPTPAEASTPAEAIPANTAAAEAATPPVARVNILNNSTETDLAKQTAAELAADGMTIGEVGNLDGTILTVPETTVYFQPEHEQDARELADRLGAIARAYDEALPTTTNGADDLTLVLAGPVTLGE